jgi:hypothetical protein
MPPKTTALSRDAIETGLRLTPLSGQDMRALLRSEGWNALDSRNPSLVLLDEFARTDCRVILDSGHLSDVFGLTRERVRKVLSKRHRGLKVPHRPLSLTIEEEQATCAFIREGSATGNHVTQRDVLNSVEERFGSTLAHGWIASFLARCASTVAKVVVSAREARRRDAIWMNMLIY